MFRLLLEPARIYNPRHLLSIPLLPTYVAHVWQKNVCIHVIIYTYYIILYVTGIVCGVCLCSSHPRTFCAGMIHMTTRQYDSLRKVHQMILRCLGWRNESAKTTSCPKPMRFSGQTPRALRRRYTDEEFCSRASWHSCEKSACRGGRPLGRCPGGKGYSGGQEWGWMKDLEGP